MYNRKHIFRGQRQLTAICLCCCFVLILFANTPASAAPLLNTPRWDVPFLGIMTGPTGFKAIDVGDWAIAMSKVTDRPSLPASQPNDWLKESPIPPEDYRFYQLQVNDGSAYRIAWVFAFNDSKGLLREFTSYFNPLLSNNQQQLMAEMNNKLKSGIQTAQFFAATTGAMKLEILDLQLIDRMKGAKEIVYTVSGRVVVDSKGLVFPVYVKGYALSREGKIAFLLVATSDSEAKFWNSVTDQLVNSLEPRRSLLYK